MTAYYNEHDKYAAAWLRNLITEGLIAPGDVDERSIEDVTPAELRGYSQCHFFAGIGVWSHALRSAGWSDDRPVWTGSCPCQPFSAAGKRGGTTDERHLWPHWFHLIENAKPHGVPVFGEQVASKDGLAWLDLIHADLEGQGYAVGAVDLCAAGVGAPHIRQRLYFVADADTRAEGLESGSGGRIRTGRAEHDAQSGLGRGGEDGELADSNERGTRADAEALQTRQSELGGGSREGVAQGDTEPARLQEQFRDSRVSRSASASTKGEAAVRASASAFWTDCDWLPCIDGKARPVELGTFPLAHGATARVGRLRAYGNAIVAPLATEFVKAYLSR